MSENPKFLFTGARNKFGKKTNSSSFPHLMVDELEPLIGQIDGSEF